MVIDAGAHLDFLDLDDLLALARLGGFLLLLIFVLAEIQDFGDRRIGIGGNLHQVEPCLGGAGKSVRNGDDPDVVPGLVDQANFPDADILVHPRTGWLALRRGSHGTTYVALSLVCSLYWFGSTRCRRPIAGHTSATA